MVLLQHYLFSFLFKCPLWPLRNGHDIKRQNKIAQNIDFADHDEAVPLPPGIWPGSSESITMKCPGPRGLGGHSQIVQLNTGLNAPSPKPTLVVFRFNQDWLLGLEAVKQETTKSYNEILQ